MLGYKISLIRNFRTVWCRQVRQLREDGWVARRRKLVKFVKIGAEFPLFVLAMPLVLVVRIIRPLIRIRFDLLRSDVIGHSVFDPEYYLSEREVENGKTFDCFYFQTKSHPNEQWSLMMQRRLRISQFVRYMDKTNCLIPGGKAHRTAIDSRGSRDFKGYLASTKPHFNFTNEENSRGVKFLESLGMNSKDRFICLIVRDSAYKEKYQKWGNRDWSYHNYRDCDIETFEEATLALAEKGYWVFRMGKAVHKPLKVDHPRILDYANTAYRSDFLDIWLFGNCYFGISTGTGIDSVADIFRKPVVYLNYDLLTYMVLWSKTITVPKKLYWISDQRFLTLREQVEHSYINGHRYDENGIEVVDLKPKEISDAVLEMEARLNGSWKENDEDKMLQNKFWELFKNWRDYSKYHGWIHPEARIGSLFLKENAEWLN
jgi:putative glycosyltransferase (TIGR04372 family)